MVKHGFFIHLHPSYSSIRNYQQKRFTKTRLTFNFYAQLSCTNDWNNFVLLKTNAPLSMTDYLTVQQSGLLKMKQSMRE